MSLLTIAQAVAMDCGFGAPASIVGNSDDTALQLLTLANKTGKALARKPWQNLQSEYTFATANGTETYALPSDFGWFTNNTAWDATNYWQLRGSLSAADWRAYKNGVVNSSPRTLFRIRGNLIYLNPIPTSVRSVTIEYISNAWVTSSGVNYTAFQADGDTLRIDDYLFQLGLTWRFLDRKGLAYDEAMQEYEDAVRLAMAHDVPGQPQNQASAAHGDVWPPLPSWSGTGLSGL